MYSHDDGDCEDYEDYLWPYAALQLGEVLARNGHPEESVLLYQQVVDENLGVGPSQLAC